MQSNEILAVVDSVSTEKGLDKDIIFSAIEIAIASASQRHFHEDADLFVQIDIPIVIFTTSVLALNNCSNNLIVLFLGYFFSDHVFCLITYAQKSLNLK